ncbi:MAG: methyltransferase domain-containing protein [bacterium]
MEPKLQRRVQRYGWDKAAGYYEGYWGAQLAEAQRRLLDLAAPRPGERVLELACGTGLVTFPLAERIGPGGALVGTDISEEMVAAAGRKAGEIGCTNVVFQRMDAEELDFEDGRFDLALCSLGLMYVPDPGQSFQEMFRVLRPGGRAAVLVWGRRNRCGWADIFPIVDARVKSEVCPLFFQLGGEGVLDHRMAAAGFTALNTERFSHSLSYGSGEEACLAAFQGGQVALAYDRFDEQTREEAHAEFLTSISSYKIGSGYQVPGEFVICSGVKQE